MNLTGDSQWIRCFCEPSNYTMPRDFARTFTVMYVFTLPMDPVNTFEIYKEFSVEDYIYRVHGVSFHGD
jgi:hypothetical protein